MWPAIVWYEMTGCTVTVAEKNKQSLGETTETTGALRALHGFFPVSKPLPGRADDLGAESFRLAARTQQLAHPGTGDRAPMDYPLVI